MCVLVIMEKLDCNISSVDSGSLRIPPSPTLSKLFFPDILPSFLINISLAKAKSNISTLFCSKIFIWRIISGLHLEIWQEPLDSENISNH